MGTDRYRRVAQSLRYVGWIQDLTLRRARRDVVEVFRDHAVGSVLDVCCGAGTLSRYLSRSGMVVTGIDQSLSMLRLARGKAPAVTFIEADVTDVELDGPVDGSVVALSLHEMGAEARSGVWRAMRRLTRAGGPLVLLDYTIPVAPALAARAAAWFIRQDECAIDRSDPGHFQNFLDFMAIGGARGWLARGEETILLDRRLLFGNLGLLVVAA